MSSSVPNPPAMLIPTRDRLILSPAQAARETKGGIILPDVAVEAPLMGTVVAVGPEVPAGLVGRTVIYAGWAGMPLEYAERPYLLLTYEDVLAIYPDKLPSDLAPITFEQWAAAEKKAAGLST